MSPELIYIIHHIRKNKGPWINYWSRVRFVLEIIHCFGITGDEESQKNGKVFYGQEPPSGQSTTTECGANYQLLALH